MAEIDLLRSIAARQAQSRRAEAGASGSRAIARQFGREYFDGPREYGYGGYRYDGRWLPIARDIVAHYAQAPAIACSTWAAPRAS